jgi:non-specific serine/threonine protein kinase
VRGDVAPCSAFGEGASVLDSTETESFGALLRQHRLRAGLTQAALAERAGIAERTIQDLERGVARPRRETVRRLISTLALPPEDRSAFEAVTPAPRRARAAMRTSGADVALVARRHNLPIQLTSLLGREREVAEVQSLIREGARLVTLTGPGGSGKTRLAIEVAGELLDRSASPSRAGISATPTSGQVFADGVFLVELAAIADPALVPATIARALGVLDVSARHILESLKAHLRGRRLLLVLDNFEQIVTAAPVVAELLATSPALKVLVTSREPLRLRGEREYDVPPLTLPDARSVPAASVLASSPAVALFVERAAAVQASFVLTDENAPAVAEICARLDGLPLAIELAAARARLLTPQMMVARLEHRLPLLTGGTRDLPDRQRTLRNTIAWSHDLLDDDERRLFRRLAIFVGGWTLEAAEVVCDLGDLGVNMLDGLESLAARSLIRRGDMAEGEARFRMLETIREYALERLDESGEATDVRRRHAGYFLALAERAEHEHVGAQQGAWLNRLEAEHDNLRAAFLWAVQEEEAEIALRLTGALSHFWEIRGHHGEGRAHLTRALRLTGTRKYPVLQANALRHLGYLAHDQGDYAQACACYEESLAIMQGLGDRRGVARAKAALAWVAFQVGDFSLSRTLQEQSLAIMRELGDRRGVALALNGLGYIASVLGNHAEARAYHEESLAIMRDLGDRRNVARSLAHLGSAEIHRRDHARARALVAESLAIIRELGDALELIRSLKVAVDFELTVGNTGRAARLQGAIDALRDSIGVPLSPRERGDYAVKVTTMRVALGELELAAAWAEGRAMSLEQAVAYALDQDGVVSVGAGLVDGVSTSASPLTPREAEVTRLVARGLTNHQIAAELVISERTASSHLYRILGKLGFRSRAQVAAWAVARGLATAPEPD